MNHHIRTSLVALAAVLSLSVIARAQDPPTLTDLSLEELMRIEVERVFGASQRMQPVTEAPASVTIVTADEIARYGYRSLAEILRNVRGLYVNDDRNYSYVGVRGFARSGDYNTRVLLLVNGHRTNDNVYDQAAIGADFGIDPTMFERVEIIRGPASSLYGTNAFFAVVNVVTKTGASLNGGSVTLERGTHGVERASASVGRRLANGVDVAVSGTYEQGDGSRRLYFPEFDAPATNGGIAEGLDGERVRQIYGHAALRGFTLTGAYGRRLKEVPTASFGTVFNEPHAREQTTDERVLADVQYERALRGTRVAGRVSFDRYRYSGTYPLPAADLGLPILVNLDSALGTRWGADGRLTRPLAGRHVLTVGAEAFDNIDQNQRNTYDQPTGFEFDVSRSSQQAAAYAQDEFKLERRVLLSAGLRYDVYGGVSRLTPRAALIFTRSANESFKYLYGNAFRAPNAYELDYHSAGIRNIRLEPESIDTHEVVWERYSGERLRTSASAYWYNAKRLITLQPDAETFDGLSFVNAGHARAAGIELEAEIRLKRGAQALASYAVQRATDQTTRTRLTNSPRHVAKLRISVPLPAGRSSASFAVQYLSSRTSLAGRTVEPAAVANLALVERIGRGLELLGTIRNVFDHQYADPASDEHLQDSIPQEGRTFRVGLRWTFSAH